MRCAWVLLAVLLAALILLHLFVAPYTKVEESFHVQAIHDILAHGFPFGDIDRHNYDHFEFPGAVPRTAVGAAVLAQLSPKLTTLSLSGVHRQILARAMLGLYNAFALGFFARGLWSSFGQSVAVWYLILQSSQFHLIYYASRPLSNMFAFGMTTIAMRYLLPDTITVSPQRNGTRSGKVSLVLLTVAGVVFRAELALLVACIALSLLLVRRSHFIDVTIAGLIGLSSGLIITTTIDSIFWKAYVWPELNAFLFNVVEGQSSAWGTEPFYFYFINALPRLLLNPLTYLLAIPVALYHPALRRPILPLLAPCMAFVTLYSAQPHKEWRFIIYIIPILTATAALGASYLWTRRDRSIFTRIASRLLVLSTLASFFLSNLVLLPASASNYPGAHALNALHGHHAQLSSAGASVYLGNLACQTGVTRFLQNPSAQGWRYDKTEDQTTKAMGPFWDQFDYVVVEASAEPGFRDSDEMSLQTALPGSRWETAEIVDGFAGISVVRPGDVASGGAERWILSRVAGEHAVALYEQLRDMARKAVLRGWWVEVKTRPRIKVLKRVREAKA
ncbi:hypothetical protein N7462_007816 [Penicillium macrosclerotiorum]|uniref:uncharacterized protein n=1 Tax=Penicillium macrosclerotiorum TaxID=303699 RepID=UPI002546DF08|nr:uncharacterized protein N7462_007816 [Penicillium macrosclerotiorum]KAJ5679572.1 hypothetical protein N7462_007816 [Penicillium macrosclerotiorum]